MLIFVEIDSIVIEKNNACDLKIIRYMMYVTQIEFDES